MSVETNARRSFGLLVKKFRAEQGLDRGKFAKLVGVKTAVIQRLEHGVPNPTRPELVRVIKILNLPEGEMNHAYNLLRIFSPRKSRRVKFHLSVGVLRHRNRRYSFCG